jgi:ABC-type sulfate transport system permease subunit
MDLTHIKKAGIFSIASLVSASSLFAQSSDMADNSSQAGSAIAGLIGGLFGLVIAVVVIVGMWKIFVKAGEPGWAAIIPIYNLYIICKITAKPIWWLLLLVLCPPVGFVIGILLTVELAKCFGKGVGFAVGMILLPYIFYPVLGFSDAAYTAPRD